MSMEETERAVKAGYHALDTMNDKSAEAKPRSSVMVREGEQTVHICGGAAVSHGPGNRTRNRRRFAGAGLSRFVDAILPYRSGYSELAV